MMPNKTSNRLQDNLDNYVIYLLLFSIIIISNFSSINLEVIMLDDSKYYWEALENQLRSNFSRCDFRPSMHYLLSELMTISPRLARFFYSCLIGITCILFYTLYVKRLKIKPELALVACLLPAVLPNQIFIPSFLIGSYPIPGLFFYVIGLHALFKYLDNQTNYWLLIFCTSIYLSLDITSYSLAALPILFLIFPSKGATTKKYLASIMTVLITAYSLRKMLNNKHAASQITTYSFDEYYHRLSSFTDIFSNYGNIIHSLINIFGVIMLISTSVIFIKGFFAFVRGNRNFHKKYQLLFFSFSWLICSSIYFLFSPSFGTRYFYIFGFAYILLLTAYLNFALEKLSKSSPINDILLLLSFVICILSALTRHNNINQFFSRKEKIHKQLASCIKNLNPQEQEQILVTGNSAQLYTGGHWNWATGYLKYISGNPEIEGQIINSKYPSRYNILDTKERTYSKANMGIDINRSLSAFHVDYNGCYSFNYLLNFDGVDYKLYDIRSSTNKQVFKGTNLNSLDDYISENNIQVKHIFGY